MLRRAVHCWSDCFGFQGGRCFASRASEFTHQTV
jgi:hypothetical protein